MLETVVNIPQQSDTAGLTNQSDFEKVARFMLSKVDSCLLTFDNGDLALAQLLETSKFDLLDAKPVVLCACPER